MVRGRVISQGGDIMAARLKVYEVPEESYEERPEPAVRVRLGDLLPLVSMAQRLNFLWLKDFLRRRSLGQRRPLRSDAGLSE